MFPATTSLTPPKFSVGGERSLPAVTDAGKRASMDLVTAKFSHQYQWPAPKDYHNYQSSGVPLFVIGPRREGTQWNSPKLMTIDQLNNTMQQAWHMYERDRSNPSQVKSKLLTDYTANYNRLGEDQYYQDQTWADCSAFEADPLLQRFTWMSHLSIDRTVRFVGVMKNNASQMPTRERPVTATSNGYDRVINYWGTVSPSQRLYFVIKKSASGAFAAEPWAGFDMPRSSDLEYKDHLGNIHYGISIYVGRVHRAGLHGPEPHDCRKLAGLDGFEFNKAHKLVQTAQTIDIITCAGDIRA